MSDVSGYVASQPLSQGGPIKLKIKLPKKPSTVAAAPAPTPDPAEVIHIKDVAEKPSKPKRVRAPKKVVSSQDLHDSDSEGGAGPSSSKGKAPVKSSRKRALVEEDAEDYGAESEEEYDADEPEQASQGPGRKRCV